MTKNANIYAIAWPLLEVNYSSRIAEVGESCENPWCIHSTAGVYENVPAQRESSRR
jgi:hypothetical protein